MSLIELEKVTTLTRPHRRLVSVLQDLQLTVEIETPFPPYSVDCYLPDLHVAVEADGPMHSAMRDQVRDDTLMAVYALPVLRIDSGTLVKSDSVIWKALALTVLRSAWWSSAVKRRQVARTAGGLYEAD